MLLSPLTTTPGADLKLKLLIKVRRVSPSSSCLCLLELSFYVVGVVDHRHPIGHLPFSKNMGEMAKEADTWSEDLVSSDQTESTELHHSQHNR